MARRSIPAKKGKPFNYPKIEVLNPGGGLNNLVSDNLIDDPEASDLNNVKFVEAGAPTKIDGKSLWAANLSNNPKGLGTFVTDSGNRYIVTVDGRNLVYSASTTDTWHTVTGATFSAGHDVTFTQTRTTDASSGVGVICIWNGIDGGAYWDGTTLSRPGTMPAAAFSIVYQGVHFAAGTSTNVNRLYLSDPNQRMVFTNNTAPTSTFTSQPHDSASVPGASVFGTSGAALIDVNPQDGDKITGLARFKDVLIIFKERSIYQLSLDPSSGRPVITPVLNYLGAISHKSIDNVANDVYYLSRLGWFTLGYQENFYNLIRSNELSVKIHPLLQTINPANLGRVCSLYRPYTFYSAYPSGNSSTNNLCVTYDTRYNAWSKSDVYHANAFTVLVDSGNKEHLLYASDDEPRIYEIIQDQFSQDVLQTVVTTTENLFINPSDEIFVASQANLWKPDSNVTIAADNTTAAVGTYSVKATKTSTVVATGVQVASDAFQSTISTNTAYTLSAYLKGPVGLVITMQGGYGLVGQNPTHATTQTVTMTGSWQRFSVTFTTPSTNVDAVVTNILWDTNDTVNIDAIQAEIGSSATTYFDGGFTGDSTHNYYWQGTAGLSPSFRQVTSTQALTGQPISTYWVSKAFDGKEPTLYKRWILLDLLFRQISGSVKVTVYADNNAIAHSSTITSGSLNAGIGMDMYGVPFYGGNVNSATASSDTTATTNIPYRIKISAVSRTLKVRVENGNVNETFVLLGLKLHYQPYSIFKFPSALKIQ